MNGGGLVCRLPEVFAKAMGGTVAAFLLAALASLALPASAFAQTVTLSVVSPASVNEINSENTVTVRATLNGTFSSSQVVTIIVGHSLSDIGTQGGGWRWRTWNA